MKRSEKSGRKAGERPVTTGDIADYVGLSRATVSYVLNGAEGNRIPEATRRKVLEAAKELGYVHHALASSLRSGHSPFVLLPLGSFDTSRINTETHEIIAKRLAEMGYTVITHLDRSITGMAAARLWAELRPRAIVVERERLTEQSLRLLKKAGVQSVIGLSYGGEARVAVPTITVDQETIGSLVGDYLAGKGHRSIAAVVPERPGDTATAEKRIAGIRKAVDHLGIIVRELRLGFDEAQALRIIRSWTPANRPSAVFAFSDEFAILFIRAIQECGYSIPGDIAVLGCDDEPLDALIRPSLSSVRFEPNVLSDAIVSCVERALKGENIESISLDACTSIIARESG
jgi:DNA-binding LacI/PurR family transcriptional regulator